MMVCTGFKIRPDDRDLTGVLASTPQPGWLARVPPVLHGHFTRAVGSQTAEVGERISAALNLNGPTDEAYLTSLRANAFALSDEGTPTVARQHDGTSPSPAAWDHPGDLHHRPAR